MDSRQLFNKIKEAKAVRAATALSEFIASGARTVDPEIYEQRFALCQACTHFEPGQFPTCKACGCFLKVKARWPTERCPLPEPKWTETTPAPAQPPQGACCG